MTHVDAPFPTRQKKQKKSLPLWGETLLLLVIALILAVVIKTFFVQAFYIPSASMQPGLQVNDRILVEKWSYWHHTPQRGDIIVFQDPGGWLGQEGTPHKPNWFENVLAHIGLFPAGDHLVKRVIGVGGDRVRCCDKQGRVTVNGHPLNERSYLPKGTAPSLTKFDIRVPAGHLWVMGDNRSDSLDSRGHMGSPGGGFLADDLVVGKVFARVWPFSRFEMIRRPATFNHIPSTPK